ncbi:ankyrin repeat domain-containing protein [Robbsia andropogonis]|uniref:ankyrin repeat domain-containing protein n=2 Tax=Robbsia andropogonis TaxID=28092 RepID=UPI002A6A89D1|nr:ankyrin repeat domain-containing protein [Robbsia andropogonis]
MKNLTEFETIPAFDRSAFLDMLLSNNNTTGSEADSTTPVGPLLRHQRDGIPHWIERTLNNSVALHKTSEGSDESKVSGPSASWKSQLLMRGLLFSSGNVPQATHSTAIAENSISSNASIAYPLLAASADNAFAFSERTNNTLLLADIGTVARREKSIRAEDEENEEQATGRHHHSHALSERQMASMRTLMHRNHISSGDRPNGDHASLINDMVSYILQHPENLGIVAHHLCRVSHDYGGRRTEPLTMQQQHAIVDTWLAQRCFGTTPEAFVANLLSSRTSERPSLPYVENIRHRLIDKMRQMTPFLSALDATSQRYLHAHVLDQMLPGLMWIPADRDEFDRMEVGTVEWGFIQAGLRFAADNGLQTSSWETAQARAVGEALNALIQEGGAPAGWVGYFAFPAQLYAIRNRENSSTEANSNGKEEVLAQALADFQAAILAEFERSNPFARFTKEMDGYLTRPQLAQAILEQKCPGLAHPEEYVSLYLHADEHDCLIVPKGAPFTHPDRKEIPLPPIADAFAEQNRRIAAAAGEIDNLMLPLAFEALGENEQRFLSSAEVRQVHASFSAAHTIRGTLAGSNRLAVEALIRRFPTDIALFVANKNGEERIYAMSRKNGKADAADGDQAGSFGYTVERIDRNEHFYYWTYLDRFGEDMGRDKDYRLEINPFGEPLKHTNEANSVLYDVIRKRNEDAFRNALHIQGFEETPIEKAKKMLWSMLPFYDCGMGVAQGDRTAVLSCVTDTLSLIPLVGQAASMTERFGSAISRATLSALRQASARGAVRGVLAKTAGMIFKQAGLAGAKTLTSNSFATLGVTALRTLDPGAALLHSAGSASMRQAARLFDKMGDVYPVVRPIANALMHRSDLLDKPLLSSRKARLHVPKGDIDVDVEKIDQRMLDGVMQDIFVRVNPSTGERFGRKYYLDAGGTLALVPRTVRQRLHDLTLHGLSGRGGPDAARKMAREDRLLGQQADAANHGAGHAADAQQVPDEARDAPDRPGARELPPIVDADAPHALNVARPLRPKPELIDLPQEMLDMIVAGGELQDLKNLYNTHPLLRDTVSGVFRREWGSRQESVASQAALANRVDDLRFLATMGVKIDGSSILATAINHRLDESTYTQLFDLIGTLNGDILPVAGAQNRDNRQTALEAAIRAGNANAVSALLSYRSYVLPEQGENGPGFLVIAAEANHLDIVRRLLDSGRVDVNDVRNGRTALSEQLFNHDSNDLPVMEYLLSRPDINLEAQYIFKAEFPKNPRRFSLYIEDPRVDVNAPMDADPALYAAHTPLTKALVTALRSGETSDFYVLVTSPRVDVTKAIQCDDNVWRTPQEFMAYFAERSGWEDPDNIGLFVDFQLSDQIARRRIAQGNPA